MPHSGRRRSSLLAVIALSTFFSGWIVGASRQVQAAPADEAAVRSLADAFFAAYASKDLDRCMALWSAAPERAARQRQLEQQFAAVAAIEVRHITVHRVSVDGDRASLRADVEMHATDVAGKPAAGFGLTRRALDFVKEQGTWKIAQEVDAFDWLAGVMVDAASEGGREALLAANSDLLTDDLTRALSRRANRGTFLWDYATTLKGYQLALANAKRVGNPLAESVAWNDIGVAHRLLAHYGEAADAFSRSLAMSGQLGYRPGMARSLANFGRLRYDQSNYAGALTFFDRSLTVVQDAPDPLSRSLASDTLHNIGIVYHAQGSYEMALTYYTKALAIRRELGNKGGVAVTLDRLGNVHAMLGDFDRALEHHQESLQLSVGTHETSGVEAGSAALLSVAGDLYTLQQKFDLAIQYKRKAVEHYRAANGGAGDQQFISATANELGTLELRAGRYAEALALAHRAAEAATRARTPAKLWPARDIAGRAHLALGEPRQARQAFEDAIRIVESLRSDVAGGATEQQRFFEDKLSPYHGMVDVLVAQNQPLEALAHAERAKARVLLDVLRSGRVTVSKAMTDREREQEQRFIDELGALNGQIVRENFRPAAERTRLADLTAQRERKRQEFDAFRANLYAVHPDLRVRRGEAAPRRVDELVAAADANTALLEFVVTDERTHLFVVTRTGTSEALAATVRAYPVAVRRSELAALAEGLRERIGRRDLGFRETARQLHRLLLAPARNQLRGKTTLVIVPDGPLWALPFQALVSENDRYVLEDHAVAYAPSLSALLEMNAVQQLRGDRGWPTTLLAFGNPSLPASNGSGLRMVYGDAPLQPLPDAEREVDTLRRMYGAAGAKVYVGAAAREDRFKAESGSARVLHLAAHGILNSASPMYSHVLLSQSGEAGEEDGLLEAWELMDMDLSAELAVLSACETALGRLGAGEGIIGLTWALFVAGVPASIVSQWKVDSASTTDLMIDFHRRLRVVRPGSSGFAKAAALRQASLMRLRSNEYRHPFYWAGFVLVGDGR